MPICTVEKKSVGSSANCKIYEAFLFPVAANCSNLLLREETKAISSKDKIPLAPIKANTIIISSRYPKGSIKIHAHFQIITYYYR